MTWIDDLAVLTAHQRARQIEDALVKHDVVAVPVVGDECIVYLVPGWREAPVRRAKIAWYRLRRRLFVAGR